MSRSAPPAARAFSLIELLVATTVLVIGIFGTLAALSAQARTRTFSNHHERAAVLLENALADYHRMSPSKAVTEITGATGSGPDRTGDFDDAEFAHSVMVEVLNESQTSDVFAADLDEDGVAGETNGEDDYDLNRNETPGETGTDFSDYNVVAIRITAKWRDSTGREYVKSVETMLYPRAAGN